MYRPFMIVHTTGMWACEVMEYFFIWLARAALDTLYDWVASLALP